MPGLHDALVPFRLDDNIGIGIDSASGDRKSLVVNPVTGQPQGARGSTSEFNIARIFQTSDLETALNIDAAASAGIASFAGVSARFNFAKQMKVQSSSLFMVVTAFVQLASESIEAPALADTPPGAGAASMVDNPTVFLQRYGDMFVRSFQRGGFFVGVLQIDTASSSEADQVAASLEGSYDLISGTASTKLQTVASQYKSQLFVHQYSEGGVILQIDDQHDPLLLLGSVGAFLRSFQDQPENVAAAFNCSLAPTEIASGPLPPNEADREHARDVIVECAKRRSATMDHLNLIQFISDHNSNYDFSNCPMDTITKTIVGLQSDLDIIARCASEAINHTSAQALMPPQYAQSLTPPVPYPTDLPNPLPTRKQGAAGLWQHTTTYNGQNVTSKWSLTPAVQPSYDAQEIGLGNATGSAVLIGQSLQINWVTSAEQGTYQWDLDETFTHGDGVLTFTFGPRAGTKSTASSVVRLPAGSAFGHSQGAHRQFHY